MITVSYPKLNTRTWTEDDLGICPGGDVGGDVQASDSWSRRFALALDNGQFAVLEFNGYWAFDDVPPFGVDYDVSDLPRGITVMVQYSHCTDLEDVGGSETYSDIRYWDHQEDETITTPRQRIEQLTQEDLSEATAQLAV